MHEGCIVDNVEFRRAALLIGLAGLATGCPAERPRAPSEQTADSVITRPATPEAPGTSAAAPGTLPAASTSTSTTRRVPPSTSNPLVPALTPVFLGGGLGEVTNSPDPAEPWRGQTGEYSPLVEVRSSHHQGFDRVVFEFSGLLPGYLVRYGPPVRLDTAGFEVQADGAVGLHVTIFGGGIWTIEGGYRPPATIVSDTTAVAEVVFVEDFEAVMQWLVGVDQPRPFRVLTLSAPTRLVIDVQAPPPA